MNSDSLGSNFNASFIELMDLLQFTFSEDFIEKWRFRFSEQFIKQFQLRLLKSLGENKPIKKDTLYLFLRKKCAYSKEQILNFFEAIEIEIYYPIIYGNLSKDKND